MNSSYSSSLVALNLGSLVHPMFGKNESVKCVVNEHGDTALVKDASLLLQLLDIEHPVGQQIVSVCTSHSDHYGCGVKSFLVMLGQLTNAYLTLCDMGIPASHVITQMRSVLEDCKQELVKLQIPLSFASTHPQGDRCLQHKPDSGFLETKRSKIETESSHSTDLPQKDILSSGTKNHVEHCSETRFVHLKMKARDVEVDDDDEDDIAWFFDRSAPDVNAGMRTGTVNGSVNVKVGGEMEELDQICSLKDADQHDSDFDDCFEEGQTDQNVRLPVEENSGCATNKDLLTNQVQSGNFTVPNGILIKVSDVKKHETISVSHPDTDSVKSLHVIPDMIENKYISWVVDEAEDSCHRNGPDINPKTNCRQNTGDHLETCLKNIQDTVKTVKRSGVYVSSRHLNLNDGQEQCIDRTPSKGTVTEASEKHGTGVCQQEEDSVTSRFTVSEIEKINKMLEKVEEKKRILPVSSTGCGVNETVDIHPEMRSPDVSIQKLNKMLEMVNVRKKGVSTTESVSNTSRHFKTLESSVAGWKENDSLRPCVSEVKKFDQKLHDKLSEKKKQIIADSLSHSRHFKSFEIVSITAVNSDFRTSDCLHQSIDLFSDKDMKQTNIHPVTIKSGKDTMQKDLATFEENPGSKSTMCSENDALPGIKGMNDRCSAEITSMENTLENKLPVPTIQSFQVSSREEGEDSGETWTSSSTSSRSDDSGDITCLTSITSVPSSSTSSRPGDGGDITCLTSITSVPPTTSTSTTTKTSTGYLFHQSVSLQDVARGLSHGSEAMMDLVLQAAENQMSNTGRCQFNPRLVHTCTVRGPSPRYTAVVQGMVIKCQTDLVSVLTSVREKRWNTLVSEADTLVNGDMSHNFHHHGYKTATKGSHVVGPESLITLGSFEQWLQDCQHVLQQLSVELILVRGNADISLKDTLLSVGIVTVEEIPYRVLEAVRETTGSELTVYITDCSKIHVCEGVTVHPFSSDWCDKLMTEEKHTTHVVLDTATPSLWQTFVLCHPSTPILDIEEQEVQACIHRLTTALHDGMVLPGGGATEMFCSQYLLGKSTEYKEISNDFDLYRPVVLETMAELFNKIVSLADPNSLEKDYRQPMLSDGPTTSNAFSEQMSDKYENYQTMRNHQTKPAKMCVSPESKTLNDVDCPGFISGYADAPVFDNYKSKMAAWSTAMDTVAMVTQTDAHIVTGVTSDDVKSMGVFINGVVL